MESTAIHKVRKTNMYFYLLVRSYRFFMKPRNNRKPHSGLPYMSPFASSLFSIPHRSAHSAMCRVTCIDRCAAPRKTNTENVTAITIGTGTFPPNLRNTHAVQRKHPYGPREPTFSHASHFFHREVGVEHQPSGTKFFPA